MPSTTRRRLIDTARNLFYQQGFRNVGLDTILQKVGISKTAFYKHFAGKDDLMLAVLENQSEWLQSSFRELIRQHSGRRAVDQLRGLFDLVEQVINSEDFRGCIFVNASMEFPLAHDPAHQAAIRNREAIENIVFEVAERAGAADPAALASELCLIMNGAYVSKQVTGDARISARARCIADRCIDAHLGRRPEPASDRPAAISQA